jgi:hypothetical protein
MVNVRFWRSSLIAGVALAACTAWAGVAQAADVRPTPTFARDIAPIFQEKCEACHRPESIAPMSLVTYEEARPWARSIKSRVEARQMPPWHLDKTVGIQHYKNDRSLSDEQIHTIVQWVDAGAPQGDPNDLPPARKWPREQGWNFARQFGQAVPDLIVRSTPWTQKAGSQDAWWKPVVPTGLTEARWVRAMEIRPASLKGRKVTHHAIAYLRQDERRAPADVQDPVTSADDPAFTGAIAGGTFMEWSVGKVGEMLRPDTGKLLLPGSMIQWDIHYSSSGEDVTDQVELGIYFYPKGQEPKFRTSLGLYGVDGEVFGGGIDLPPNQVTVSEGFHVLQRSGRLESFQPHMHLRGKAMSLDAILPNGQQQILSYVPDFNFNWHNTYQYADDEAPLLPKGTILHITAWHDNTAAKKSNPDPNQWVGYGDRTVDEMAHAWINITYMSEKDFKAETDARAAAHAGRTQQQ